MGDFNTEEDDSSAAILAPGQVIPDNYKAGMGFYDQQIAQLLPRQSKLMQELNSPDHLSLGEGIGRALIAAIPTALGAAFAGNRGGAAGANAGLAGLQEADKIDKEQQARADKYNVLQYASNQKLIDQYNAAKQTLLKGGLERSGKQADIEIDQLRNQPGGDRYGLEMAKIGAQGNNQLAAVRLREELNGSRNGEGNDPKAAAVQAGKIKAIFEKQIGTSREQAAALNDIETLLKTGSNLDFGNLQTMIARSSGQKGNLAIEEANKALRETFGNLFVRWQNKLTGSTLPEISEDQKRAILNYVQQKRASVADRVKSSFGDIVSQADLLGPSIEPNKRHEYVAGLASGLLNQLRVSPDNVGGPQQQQQSSSSSSGASGDGVDYVALLKQKLGQ